MQLRFILLLAFLMGGLTIASVSPVQAQAEVQPEVESLDLTVLSQASTATHLRLTDEQRDEINGSGWECNAGKRHHAAKENPNGFFTHRDILFM